MDPLRSNILRPRNVGVQRDKFAPSRAAGPETPYKVVTGRLSFQVLVENRVFVVPLCRSLSSLTALSIASLLRSRPWILPLKGPWRVLQPSQTSWKNRSRLLQHIQTMADLSSLRMFNMASRPPKRHWRFWASESWLSLIRCKSSLLSQCQDCSRVSERAHRMLTFYSGSG